MYQGYESNYKNIESRLTACDLKEAAERLGLPAPVDGAITMWFLGVQYEITRQGITGVGGAWTHPADRSILVFYVTSRGRGEPAYSYCMMRHFVQGPMGGNVSWQTVALAREYGSIRQMQALMAKIGAVYEGRQKNSAHIWAYTILPKIPMQIIFYEADDEFPSELKFMFDTGTDRFLEFEQIAFLSGSLVRMIKNVAKDCGL